MLTKYKAKTTLLFIFQFLFVISLNAQTPKIDWTEEQDLDGKMRLMHSKHLGEEGAFLFSMKRLLFVNGKYKSGGDQLGVSYLDNQTMTITDSKTFSLTYKGEKAVYNQIRNLKGASLILSNVYDKKENTWIQVGQKLNHSKKIGDLSEPMELIRSKTNNRQMPFEKKIAISSDTTKILVCSPKQIKAKAFGTQTYRYSYTYDKPLVFQFKVYDSDLNLLWEFEKEFSSSKKFNFAAGININNDGLIFGDLYNMDEKSKIQKFYTISKEGEINYHKYDILPGKSLETKKLVAKDGQMEYFGFYAADKGEQIEGYFHATLDLSAGNVKGEYSEKIDINNMYVPSKKDKKKKNVAFDKYPTMSTYFFEDSDEKILILNDKEEANAKVQMEPVYSGASAMLVVKLSADNKVEWSQYIDKEKEMKSNETKGFLYTAFAHQGNMYLLFHRTSVYDENMVVKSFNIASGERFQDTILEAPKKFAKSPLGLATQFSSSSDSFYTHIHTGNDQFIIGRCYFD